MANIIGLTDLFSKEKDYPEEVKNKFMKALLEKVKRLDNVISDLNAILQVKVEMGANNTISFYFKLKPIYDFHYF